jgi:hypothetical protein
MSWFSTLFSSAKTVDNVLNKDDGLLTKFGGWVDRFNFTEQERATANASIVESCTNFVKMTLGESTVRSKSRRRLALLWVRMHLAMILGTMGTAYFNMQLAQFYMSIVFSTLMVTGTLMILGFFFGSHMLSSHMGLNKKKKD